MPISFQSLSLSPALLKCLDSIEYHQCTDIQALAIPPALENKDVIAKAKTGSGKTVAFALPILERLNVRHFGVQALVLCPTRELADQVAKEIRTLARFIGNVKVITLCGGMPMGPQIGSLEHGAHIVVGTPGRLCAHLRKQKLDLSQLKTLVLDEADRMLEMGFEEDLTAIVDETPRERQTLLFSATFPDDIERLSNSLLSNPVIVESAEKHEQTIIEQRIFNTSGHTRLSDLYRLYCQFKPSSCIVFCNTKQSCNDVVAELKSKGIPALALHGDFEQKERDQVLIQFANQSCTVLVATDVAARGLHIDQLDMVINYELSRQAETYTHRIGRTGRAGQSGIAASLMASNESRKLEDINISMDLALMPENLAELDDADLDFRAPMVTLVIDGGKRDKLRAGDLLGALTGSIGLQGSAIGKIDISVFQCHVAIKRAVANKALKGLQENKIKNRQFKVRKLA